MRALGRSNSCFLMAMYLRALRGPLRNMRWDYLFLICHLEIGVDASVGWQLYADAKPSLRKVSIWLRATDAFCVRIVCIAWQELLKGAKQRYAILGTSAAQRTSSRDRIALF